MGRSEAARLTSTAGTTALGSSEAQVPEPDTRREEQFARSASDPQRAGQQLPSVDLRHDLRHAAATILLLLATIRDATDDPRTIAAHDSIAHCAHTIAEMVDDEAYDASSVAPVQIDELARVVTMRTSLLYNGAIECDASPATVLATDTDVSRLFANLIQNSCRAAGPHGTVEVRVRELDHWCELQVGDSGSGFSDNVGPRGIGLSSITAIAVRLGGDVTFGRSTLGGALVTVKLPRFIREEPTRHHGGAAS
jgi:signal transduction histidine kinase